MRQADFVHLHLHSAYSLLQSTIRLAPLIKKAREFRLPALAITDHGNLLGCVEFYDLAYDNGIKPIIGCELGVSRPEEPEVDRGGDFEYVDHALLLARNRKGYENLLQLVTKAHSQGWQEDPRITASQLHQHHRGLIILSGCHRGGIPAFLFKEDERRAKTRAFEYLDVFGREFFFIELQPALTDEHRRLNESLLSLARQLDVKVVATANCHAVDSRESDLLRILTAIRLGSTVQEIPPPMEHGFLSPEEMKAEFAHLPEAITATMSIAECCNVDLDLGKIRIPRFPLEKGQDALSVLRQKAIEGLEKEFCKKESEIDSSYRRRLDSELETIAQLGLADYFLLVADFVQFARAEGIPVGPGSGSAGSSLAAHALGITTIDPVEQNLLFERFVNSLRLEFPDIELGFGMEMREEVHQYLRSKYGQDRVAHIVSLVTMQQRSIHRDLGKVLNMSPETAEDIVEDRELAGRRDEVIRGLSVEQTFFTQTPRRVQNVASMLEGLPRQVSTHATGLVISDGPLVQNVPLFRGLKNEWVSQYNSRALKRVGIVKFDFIARKNLTVIRKSLALSGNEEWLSAALRSLPLDDKESFELLCQGRVGGIPYLETPRARDLLLKWQPREWQDLLELLALIRPVALERGLTEKLLSTRRKEQPDETHSRPKDERITGGSGKLLFDVDLVKLVAQKTGCSLEKADKLYRLLAISAEEEKESKREEFIEEVQKRSGEDGQTAERVWRQVKDSAGWLADKSKTVAQALTVLQAAFIKARFPEAYMAALLSSELHQHDLMSAHVETCHQEGVNLFPPDVNRSEVEFTVEAKGVRVGLAAIRHVSRTTAGAIVEVRRKTGQFGSLFELCASVDLEQVDKRALGAMIKSGAMDGLGLGRKGLYEKLSEVLDRARRGQMALFDGGEMQIHHDESSPTLPDWDEYTKLAKEKEALGFYHSGHPLSEFRAVLEGFTPGGALRLQGLSSDSRGCLGGMVEEIRVTQSRKGEPLHFVRVEDYSGSLEVLVFNDIYKRCENHLFKGALVLVRGRIAKENGQVKLVADDIMPLKEAAMKLATSIHVHLSVEGLSVAALSELQRVLAAQRGSCPVYLHFKIGQHTEVIQRLPAVSSVLPAEDLKRELERMFGENCVVFGYSD